MMNIMLQLICEKQSKIIDKILNYIQANNLLLELTVESKNLYKKESIVDKNKECIDLINYIKKSENMSFLKIEELCDENIHNELYCLDYFNTMLDQKKHIESENDDIHKIVEKVKCKFKEKTMFILCFINYYNKKISLEKLSMIESNFNNEIDEEYKQLMVKHLIRMIENTLDGTHDGIHDETRMKLLMV